MALHTPPFWALLLTFLTLLTIPTTATKVRTSAADPTVMKIGNTYYSAESDGSIWVRAASSLEGLGAPDVRREQVWVDTTNMGEIWAPEITTDLGRTYIYFSAGRGHAHRMYVISAGAPLGQPYSTANKLALPGDQWAIDGTFFVYGGLGWFVWSGWERDVDQAEQNLYICRMASPTQPTGGRSIISQPREWWETERINEGPQAIVDPEGLLHIVYSAGGSWTDNYCMADLRLRKGGDPKYVWDWYKSNGCLFGSHPDRMMSGWEATRLINGPGHHTFVLDEGKVANSPPAGRQVPFMFHGVDKGLDYNWGNRAWYTGSFVWWGSTTYSRANVPGDWTNTGASLKFFEG